MFWVRRYDTDSMTNGSGSKTEGGAESPRSPPLWPSATHSAPYESRQRRVPTSTLPLLARTLGVSLKDLIGVPATRNTGKRGPAPKLQQQLEQLSRLPKAQQKLVS